MEAEEFVVEITEYSNIGYGWDWYHQEIKKLGITIAAMYQQWEQ